MDLRDEFIEKDEALALFVVLLQLFADARIDGREGGEVLDGALHEVTRPGDVQNPLVTAGLDGVPENRRLPGAGRPP